MIPLYARIDQQRAVGRMTQEGIDTDRVVEEVLESLAARLTAADPEFLVDPKHVDDMDSKVHQIDHQIDAWKFILHRVQKKLSVCRTRRNACTLTNNLPLDIVLVIFREATEQRRKTKFYYRKLFTLRSVCRAWMSAIDDHPPFWVPAFPEHSSSLHDLTISRARNLPLEVHYPRHTGTSRQEQCRQFLSRVEALHWPLKTFHFHDTSYREDDLPLESFLTSPAPHLQSFELASSTSMRILDTLFSGHAPALQHACLSHVSLKSTVQPFSQLRRLELAEVRWLTAPRLLHLLSHCPDLEHLLLASISLKTDDPSLSPVPTISVTLSRLQTLDLRFMSSETCGNILRALPLPASTRVNVGVSASSPGLHDLLSFAMAAFSASAGVYISHTYTGNSTLHVVTVQGDNWGITITKDGFQRSVNSEWYRQLLTTHIPLPDSIRLATVSFTLSWLPDGVENIVPVLNAMFPSLQKLSLDHFSGTLGEALAEELGVKHDENTWSFPRLHTIRISKGFYNAPAVHAVQLMTRLVEGRRRVKAPVPIGLMGFKFTGTAARYPGLEEPLGRLRELVPVVEVLYGLL